MTIYLGVSPADKSAIVSRYVQENGIQSVKILSPERFAIDVPACGELIDWPEIIMYRTFYRMLREIGPETLVVVNECLRKQDRSDLIYNCIRHFLSQTNHQLVFQWLPIIDGLSDWMTLLDFDTKSRFKGLGLDSASIEPGQVVIRDRRPIFTPVEVDVTDKTRTDYDKTRKRLFDGIGAKDPHTIPRNLYLVGGEDKASAAGGMSLVGRNNRFGLSDFVTYRDAESDSVPRSVFEFPHNFIDMADFLCVSGQESVEALVTELKVDQWYFDRFTKWSKRIGDAYTAIRQRERGSGGNAADQPSV